MPRTGTREVWQKLQIAGPTISKNKEEKRELSKMRDVIRSILT